MHSRLFLLLLILGSLLLAACKQPLMPTDVAAGFWTAVKNNNIEQLKRFITQDSIDNENLGQDLLPIESFSFGKLVIDGGYAELETELVVSGEDNYTLPLKTILKQEAKDKSWKVDYAMTIEHINQGSELANVLNELDDISKKMLEGLNESLDEFTEAIPMIEEELSNIEQEIKSKLPELREKIDEFTRRLEEALKDRKGKQQSEQETIEI